jgi:antitoxin Phd
MNSFPVTKLNRTAGEVLDAAVRGPVELTHRGRRKYVLMPADHFDRLIASQSPRVLNINTMSNEDRDMILTGLAGDEG